MGLPSGTQWAKFDIDVTQPDGFCASEYQYEKSFFSWANVQGHNPDNNSFVDVYNWGNVNAQEPWYEGQPYGETPGSLLESDIPETAEYDAAKSILSGAWHLPTATQIAELFNNIDYLNADGTIKDESETDKLITLNGIVGIWVQSKINGNRLFFACSGYGNGTSWISRGTFGYYWSSSFGSARSSRYLNFSSSGVHPQGNSGRYGGFAIRPVQG